MFTVGAQEMVVIFLVALVLFGPKKLPELGRTIGKALTEFRRAQSELKSTFETHLRELEKETQSIKTATDSYTKDIYNYYTESDTAYPGSTPAVEAAATLPALPAPEENQPAATAEPATPSSASATTASEPAAPASEPAKPSIEPAVGTVPRNGSSLPHEAQMQHQAPNDAGTHESAENQPAPSESHSVSG